IVGTGYVGLVTGACLAESGLTVDCVDVDAEKVERLQRGEVPIYEPGLDALVAGNADAGRLRFTTDLAGAVAHAEAVFIAVGTPSAEDGAADLSAVFGAAERIARSLARWTLIVLKSTVPV